ncbi:hypothetical protein DAPPUDRAFT_251703 [Daphnia pulex]|uniref:Uncharacterized protein n=1 Tax=Daphnia pulex TaxID=6669 RepID=E9H0Y9_DAPPU|nr:hypothetical protein DAPPUDRAFT_251703 [Daphnia pulex]|eukprot:EFX74542.1 hypothetical protein DAPPUDRAFT_251703 [Daphnia pulex]
MRLEFLWKDGDNVKRSRGLIPVQDFILNCAEVLAVTDSGGILMLFREIRVDDSF